MDQSLRDATRDRMLGGRLALRQPVKGYRAGLDAALLAAACDARPGERVLEAGCGVGAVVLAAAMRRPEARFTGIERDEQALALAKRNIAENELALRVVALAGDVAIERPSGSRFDLALCNPPYFDDPGSLRAPHPAKRGAWLAEPALGGWASFLVHSVRDGGRVIIIHRAERLADLVAALAPKVGSFQIRPIHPYADAPAGRIVVRGVRGGRGPLRLLPSLTLHVRDGPKHTPETEAILRGEAELTWL
jgi:tRNA1(Val) A37 N6-methylase TrmN6